MLFEFLHSKIHRATITDSNLNYVGSITIDEEFVYPANDISKLLAKESYILGKNISGLS